MPPTDLQPDESGSTPILAEDAPKSQRAFSRVTLELSDEELTSPGARKLLLQRIAADDELIDSLKSFRDKFHEADKSNGILGEKLRISKADEAISIGTLVVGAAALGYAPSLWAVTTPPHAGPFALAFGVVLIVVGIWAKVFRK